MRAPNSGHLNQIRARLSVLRNAAEEINILREFRDKALRPNPLGVKLVAIYYKTSPHIADFISQNEALRTAVRMCLIDPIVAILNWSHGLWS